MQVFLYTKCSQKVMIFFKREKEKIEGCRILGIEKI